MPSVQAAASSLGLEANIAAVHTKEEIEGVVAAQARKPGGGIIVTPDPFNVADRDLIVAQTARYRLPAIYFNRSFADSGGLIVYGDVFPEQFSPGGCVRRPCPQGREIRRPSRSSVHQVRVDRQSQGCEGAWPHRASNFAYARRRGDRMSGTSACGPILLQKSAATDRAAMLFVRAPDLIHGP